MDTDTLATQTVYRLAFRCPGWHSAQHPSDYDCRLLNRQTVWIDKSEADEAVKLMPAVFRDVPRTWELYPTEVTVSPKQGGETKPVWAWLLIEQLGASESAIVEHVFSTEAEGKTSLLKPSDYKQHNYRLLQVELVRSFEAIISRQVGRSVRHLYNLGQAEHTETRYVVNL